jgi:hypothetical protein
MAADNNPLHEELDQMAEAVIEAELLKEGVTTEELEQDRKVVNRLSKLLAAGMTDEQAFDVLEKESAPMPEAAPIAA